MGDAQAHDVSETELRSLIYTVIPGSMLRIAPE
jgi:hypothetical protein